MVKVRTLRPLNTAKGKIPAGRIISIPEHLVERLKGKVEPLPVSPESSSEALTGTSHNLTATERIGLRLLREGEHLPGAAAFLERLRREGKLLPATETRH